MNAKRSSLPRRLAALFAALAVWAIALSPAQAQARTVVRVGYYENEVFEEGAREGAVKTGYAYEYYQKISEYTGWKYEYVYGSFSDVYQMLLDGEIDLLAGLAWREDRQGIVGYPQLPMGQESYNLVRHEGAEDITSDPASLSGRRIGVLESAMADVLKRYLSGNDVEAQIVIYPDLQYLFADFDSGLLDVMAAEGDGAYSRDHAQVVCAFGESEYYLCVSSGRDDLLEALNDAQALLAAEEPNYIHTLRAKYYSYSVAARAFSQAEREWMEGHDAIRVGYLMNYMPYSDADGSGRATGIVADLVPDILSALGVEEIEVTYQGFENYDDMVDALARDEIDTAFPVGGGLYYSEESGFHQSTPVVSASTELIYRMGYADTNVFAVNENNRMQYYYVRTNYPEAEIRLYPSIGDCLSAVLSGQAGCTTLNGLRANDILKNSRYKGLSLRQSSRRDDRCFGVEIGNEGLLKLINRGLNVLGTDYAQSISYRYTGDLYRYGIWDMIRDNMAVFGTAILLVAGLIILFLLHDARRTHKEVKEKEAARQTLENTNRELAKSQQALSQALDAAEKASQAKTAFLNNMSHDIRTPMNAIVGFTALAQAHIDNREQALEDLDKISVSSQHLLSLINDVLDMSRIESGKMAIHPSGANLPQILHDLKTIIQSAAKEKELNLYFEAHGVVHEDVVTDKLRLNQALLNLLSNAVKFTPAGGCVRFEVTERPSPDPDRALFRFRVRDDGIGMSGEFQKTLFEPFTREKTSTVSGIQGTGLGMAITKSIVDMMGGSISVTSQEGQGTEFVVDIPCGVARPAEPISPIPLLRGARALVVDDDESCSRSICAMLEEIGLRAQWAASGQQAEALCAGAIEEGDPFRAFVVDWIMPGESGLDAARRLRAMAGPDVPIVMATAYDCSEVEKDAMEAGVTVLCPKPLFLSDLRDALTRPLTPEKAARPARKQRRFHGRRVLLAEDNELNQMIAQAILEEAGLAVDIAPDGEAAVEKIESQPAGYYSVVLMDIQMPRMDGYEAARRIRAMADPVKAGVPIVAVTANAFEEDKKNALSTGMNSHLAKPYDVDQIMETLEKLIQ